LVKKIGLDVNFYLPRKFLENSIDSAGFYSFLQGYPLPGGESLTSYAFSGFRVEVSKRYIGLLSPEGKKVAYSEKEPLPGGYVVIESLRDKREVASKGYYLIESP
jgi:hypothetical protein